MGEARSTFKKVTLSAAGGPTAIQRIWDAPVSEVIKDLTIWITSNGAVTAAGNLDWKVFYGGTWDGEPYREGSSHIGGVSQGSGSIAGGAVVLSVVHEDASYLPPNKNIPFGSGIKETYLGGFPIVMELENKKAAPVTVHVAFLSKCVSDKV